MPTVEWLAEQFEKHRPHLRAVAYRMLGSASEAEDAVQESWIRLGRTDVGGVENLRAWLTTVVARMSLDMLRTRASRREDSLDVHVPDPIISRAEGDPESNAMLSDSIGLALLVVLVPPGTAGTASELILKRIAELRNWSVRRFTYEA